MVNIETRYDRERGCGWRKHGGTYLVTASTLADPCNRMPLPLTVCGTCSRGIHQTRSWTWLTLSAALVEGSCWIPGSYTSWTGRKDLRSKGFFQRGYIGHDPRGKLVKTICYAKIG